MTGDDNGRSSVARRVGSRVREQESADRGRAPALTVAAGPSRAWVLRIAPAMLAIPLIRHLVAANVAETVALAAGLVLIYGGMVLVEQGLAREADYHARTLVKAPRPPRKLLGAVAVGLGALVAAFGASSMGIAPSILFGAAAGLGCAMAYGLDPRTDKGLAPELARKAGVKTEQVIEAITEAEAKIVEIERSAARLENRELTGRLDRIAAQARAVLAQIGKDPADIRRARRFLVTYLDGTRDVVRKYAAQQQDLAETELADSFRHVLDTVEQVFTEQEEVLKRNESLDLEVQIEVLRTQLEREGVG